MGSFFQDIIALLLIPPGNLVYHLVVAFSVAGALALALSYWRESGTPLGKRMVTGLIFLLVLRLALFVAAGISWQGVINGSVLLPPLDRAFNLMSLVIIVWMWVYPRPTRLGDAATVLLALLVITLFVFSLVWWSTQSALSDFIGSSPDLATVMLSLGITTAGGLLLAMRRPAGWGYGLGMLFILLVGDVAYLTYPYPEGDFAGAVRLAQMVAFPMLLILPLRFSDTLKADQPELEHTTRMQDLASDGKPQTDFYQALLSMVSESDPDRLYQSVVKLVADQWLADVCLLVSPPGPHGKIEILGGYDLIQERSLGNSILNSQSIPVIASALRRGRALRLPASSTSPDLAGLVKLLEIKSIGHLLTVPVVDDEGSLIAGLIMLTPYTKRSWTADDQFRLTDMAKPLAQVLQHNKIIASLNSDLDQARSGLMNVQDEADKYQKENELLISQLGINLDNESDHQVHAANLAALVAAHEAAQETIEKLQAENFRLQREMLEHLAEIQAAPDSDSNLGQTPGYPDAQAEAELRLALEEVAYLKSLLYESDRRLLEFKEEVATNSTTSSQGQDYVAQVQDLRQPMSSIVGYTDFLLDESIGILGTLQRRFLERIRSSAERMTSMVDNLILVAGSASKPPESAAEYIDIVNLIDDAISSTSDQMREKNIALRMDLPKQIPNVSNNRTSLQQLLETLINNASNASQDSGEITLRVRLEGEDGAKDFVLIQVENQGGGLAPQVIPALNSSMPAGKRAAPSEVGESRESLLYIRSLAESLGGRIWVDANPGGGSIFSLLFPIILQVEFNDNGAGGFG